MNGKGGGGSKRRTDTTLFENLVPLSVVLSVIPPLLHLLHKSENLFFEKRFAQPYAVFLEVLARNN